MEKYPVNIAPMGPYSLEVTWPERVEESILNDILSFESHIRETLFSKDDDWETVPAYNSLLLIRRNAKLDVAAWKVKLQKAYGEDRKTVVAKSTLWHVPVCYDAEFGLDLASTAKTLGFTPKELIAAHCAPPYTLYGIGFLPGFMYLGGIPSTLEIPRREQPRLDVAAGAVGLAGKQTGIYPQTSPGGWNIIGSCPIPLFDAEKEPPCFVSVGDKVQFYPIDRATYDLIVIEVAVGIYQIKTGKLS